MDDRFINNLVTIAIPARRDIEILRLCMETAFSWWGGLRAPGTWRARLEGGLGPCSALSRGRGLPMLVRSPVTGQTKWFLRRLPVDQRSHPLEGSPSRGRLFFFYEKDTRYFD
ncbi:hypothetical protein E2C01_022642 [Portunus trituberculatus]|uniref:Uncharacterized protein n=1 Tax=Portunus trituberculatus TaxID=210409 RepID=A0A5B7E8G4_PORTR|nr:hypothetical protein [Portunus trituberculatus]